MRAECADFVKKYLPMDKIANSKILEIGSRNAAQGNRHSIKGWIEVDVANQYVGTDMREGENVDLVCDVADLGDYLEPAAFDIVLCLETLEHVKDWTSGIVAIKRFCKPGGLMIVTTVPIGFPKHDHPGDYWRYTAQNFVDWFEDEAWWEVTVRRDFVGVAATRLGNDCIGFLGKSIPLEIE